jgi:DNA-binding GntR family transcriptional regulator
VRAAAAARSAAPGPPPTAEARATETLRAAILAGGLRPGDRVNQEEWAERIGVSAIPVREALRALAGEGLVTYRPRRGYAVTELSLAELEEVYALRRMLETAALERGVGLAGVDDVAALRDAPRTWQGSCARTVRSTTSSTASPAAVSCSA